MTPDQQMEASKRLALAYRVLLKAAVRTEQEAARGQVGGHTRATGDQPEGATTVSIVPVAEPIVKSREGSGE